jgi:ATP-binding cassette subfamily F protein 3
MMKNLAKEWTRDDGTIHKVFAGLTATVHRQDKIAVVGVNGAGKSTLLKVICDLTKPSGGEVAIGPSIKVGYFSQFSLDQLNPENTVLEEVSAYLKDASNGYIRNLLAAFLFRGDDVEKKIKVLSGGEKSRVVLSILMSTNNNLLVLDEPTNLPFKNLMEQLCSYPTIVTFFMVWPIEFLKLIKVEFEFLILTINTI